MELGPQAERFVLHFGEMGGRWGVNRTVGQIYALVFLSPRALHADEIAETLGFSRSNVSMGIRELQSWRSEEHTSELQSLMRISYAVFCLKKKTTHKNTH